MYEQTKISTFISDPGAKERHRHHYRTLSHFVLRVSRFTTQSRSL